MNRATDCTDQLSTELKLARFPTRSPLPLAALPSMSLIPSAPLRRFTQVFKRRLIRSNLRKSVKSADETCPFCFPAFLSSLLLFVISVASVVKTKAEKIVRIFLEAGRGNQIQARRCAAGQRRDREPASTKRADCFRKFPKITRAPQ
jgi:hypothetical protein